MKGDENETRARRLDTNKTSGQPSKSCDLLQSDLPTATTITTSSIATIVTVLCGLPGSGKSTVAKKLALRCQQHHDSDEVFSRVVHIEYDAVETALLSASASASALPSSPPEQQQLPENNNHANTDGDGDAANDDDAAAARYTREIWKKSRIKSLDVLKTALLNAQEEERTSVAGTPSSISDDQQPVHQLIIMDDNFHLRSMRREVYRICQDSVVAASISRNNDNDGQQQHTARIYFAIVWLDVPKEVCLDRNQRRAAARSVPDDVVERMSETLEPPGRDPFEQCFVRFVDSGDDDVDSILYDFATKECMENFDPVPLPPPTIDMAQLEEERRKTRESWLHAWDQRLRSWVGIVATISRKDTGSANKARKQLLQILRQQQESQQQEQQAVCSGFLAAMETKWTEDQIEQFHKAIQEQEL